MLLSLDTWEKSSPSSIVSNCELCFFCSLAITGWVGYAPCSGLPFPLHPLPCGSNRRSTSPTSLDFFSPSSLPGVDYIVVVDIPSFSVVCVFCVSVCMLCVCVSISSVFARYGWPVGPIFDVDSASSSHWLSMVWTPRSFAVWLMWPFLPLFRFGHDRSFGLTVGGQHIRPSCARGTSHCILLASSWTLLC